MYIAPQMRYDGTTNDEGNEEMTDTQTATHCTTEACPFTHSHTSDWCGYKPGGYRDVREMRSAELVSEFGQLKAGGGWVRVESPAVRHQRLSSVVNELRARHLLD